MGLAMEHMVESIKAVVLLMSDKTNTHLFVLMIEVLHPPFSHLKERLSMTHQVGLSPSINTVHGDTSEQ